MKKILFYCFVFFSVVVSAQKNNNKFSLEMNVGSTNPFSNLTKDYYANYVGFLHADLGGRYMFTEALGLKLDFGMDRFTNDNLGTYKESLPFKSLYFRSDIQGIINIGKILHFSDWTKRIGLLGHVGMGYSMAFGDSSTVNTSSRLSDHMINYIIGFSPQFKINSRLALNLDLSAVSNVNPSYNFDFKDISNTRYGMIANISVGMAYYFGKYKSHFDWDYASVDVIPDDTTSVTKVDPVDVKNIDLDKDGVPDSTDFCPEEFGLIDFQGCPKPEFTFDCSFDNFPVITFNKARFEVEKIYKPIIDSLAKCMLENPNKKIVIYGHTDKYGDTTYTNGLSYNRADQVKKEIVIQGVSPDRIFVVGQGYNKAKISDADYAKIKHNRVVYITAVSSNQDDIRVLESGEYLQGLFFTVQIGAYKKVIKNNKFNKLGKVLISKSPDGYMRYSINVYQNFEDAYAKWKEIRGFGFSQDAFVSAYFLGEKITIKEAQEMIMNKGTDIIQK